MNYKSVVVTKRGGPEVLQIVENEMRLPTAKEARIKVLATGVGRTDINYRYGLSPFAPKVPFVPGYEIMGIVDAIGKGVTRVAVGDPVAALIGHGGYSEMIYLGQEHLVRVPESLDPADVVTVVLNYVSAYQMLHRVAKVKAGDKVLVNGASGGMGTALLELGKLAGLKMYGTASQSKHSILKEFGTIPIDYRTQDFVEIISKVESNGLDFVFDGMGGGDGNRVLSVLRSGGKLVAYAAPSGGVLSIVKDAFKLIRVNLFSKGRSAEFYGITALYLRDKNPFMVDLPKLFTMLEEGKIKPIITEKLPLLDAKRANELLENGQVTGNIVLLSPELIKKEGKEK
jgi:NADPH:quinone reductase-like Zn-dependent oxidoreductase